MNVILLSLLDLASVFIRFRERVWGKQHVSSCVARACKCDVSPKVLRFSMDIRLSVGARVGGVCGDTNAWPSCFSWGLSCS